jgi:hypothetical protein
MVLRPGFSLNAAPGDDELFRTPSLKTDEVSENFDVMNNMIPPDNVTKAVIATVIIERLSYSVAA